MLHALITFATQAEGEESSKTLFYVLGGLAAVWAVVISAIGIMRHETFPPSPGVARAVMGISALVVLAAMASSVLTA